MNLTGGGKLLKTWTDIQADLKYMKEYIAALTQEIEQSRPRETDTRMLMYKQIDRMAQQYPIENHRLRAATDIAKKSYLYLLASIAHLVQNQLEQKLLFLQRIACGINCDISSEELLKSGVVHKSTAIDRVLEQAGDHLLSLLLDSLLVVNLAGRSSDTELRVIAELAALFKVNQAEMAVIAQLASSVIQQSKESFYTIQVPEGQNWFGLFTHHVPEEWLKALRKEGGSFSPAKSGEEFIEKEFSSIKQGDLIYSPSKDRKISIFIFGLEVKAPADGYLMYLNWRERISVFIVNGFDDHDRVREWAQAEGHLT
jgi:hypothetical protein